MAIFDGNNPLAPQVNMHPGLIAVVNAVHSHNADPSNADRQLLQAHGFDLWHEAAMLLSATAPRDFILYVYSDGVADYFKQTQTYAFTATTDRRYFNDVAKGLVWMTNGVFYHWDGAKKVLNAYFFEADHSHVGPVMAAYDSMTNALQWPIKTYAVFPDNDGSPAELLTIEELRDCLIGGALHARLIGPHMDLYFENAKPHGCTVSLFNHNSGEKVAEMSTSFLLTAVATFVALIEYHF